MLENIAEYYNIDPSYADLVRGLIGDVFVHSPETGELKATAVDSCPRNSTSHVDILSDAAEGDLYFRPSTPAGAQCLRITDNNRNQYTRVETVLRGIADKKRADQALDDEEEDLISRTPIDVDRLMNVALNSEDVDRVIGFYNRQIAEAYTYYMISDLLVKAKALVNTAQIVWKTENEAEEGQPDYACAIDPISNVGDGLQQMNGNIESLQKDLGNAFLDSLRETSHEVQLNKSIYEVHKEIQKETARQLRKRARLGW